MISKWLRGGLLAAALAGEAAQAAPGLCDGGALAAAAPVADAPLTLDAALRAVDAASPELRAAALETLALRAEARQAGRRANPEIEVELEEFNGAGWRAFGASEATVSIAQPLALGRRLARARAAGEAWAHASAAGCAALRRDLLLETAGLFHDLAAAEARVGLAGDAADLAGQVSGAVRRRVGEGGAPRIDLAPAEAEHAAARADLEAARAEAAGLRLALAALWGEGEARFGPVQPDDRADTTLPPVEEVLARMDGHPALASAHAAGQARRAEAALARAEAFPDATVRLGMRSYRDTGDRALIAGVSVPLPLFDRNQGGREASRRRAEAAGIEAVALDRRLTGRVRAAHAEAASAQTRARVLAEEAAPAARDGFAAAQAAYREGRYGLNLLLDARRRLIEAETRRVDAERDARKARDTLLALGGYPLFMQSDVSRGHP
ncbi:TolC family protein [Glycocaulis profundi]|nr:TolC family protein [Glycocaulis profundi]